MNAEEGQPEPQPGGEAQPTEEEMRQRIESVVSVLNLAARRIAKEDEQDLEQGRIGIEAVRAVVDLLDPEPAAQVRSALSEVQMLYAQYANEGGEPPEGGGSQPPEGGGAQPPGGGQRAPGPGFQGGSSKLLTPGRG